ncbi:hypothetical protein HAX54_020622 [Datura stramonium]|uniref:SPX domain-containing protein n=1 Tax=Datura stramonium TaxID=4076 RepID=A0ABS8USM8_DATST|nr:hypothetical protein [Datura stramonium]
MAAVGFNVGWYRGLLRDHEVRQILMMLMTLIEQGALPDWQDKFLSYKDLKKQLKLIYLIKGKVLRDSVVGIRSSEELMRVGRDLVDLHGQMVLLENYSALNYTGLVKILKKYDKRTGALIRLPVIQKPSKAPEGEEVVEEVAEEILEELARRVDDAEELAETERKSLGVKIFLEHQEGKEVPGRSEEFAEIENKGSMYLKLTKSALRVLQEIRSGSSTVSMFSLPPMERNEMPRSGKSIPVVEQAAE